MDWNAPERDYVETGATYAALAEKYGVSVAALSKQGYRRGWVAKRREYVRKLGVLHARDVRKPEPDARRTREKLLAMADRWADGDREAIADTGDYRRVVQSVLDLGRAADEGPREIRVVMDPGAEDFSG